MAAATAPVERALRGRPGNLPADLTSFVGRRQELAEIKRLLTSTRLLTLTGSGGSGKTRLALRAATEMSRNFADGVWVVALAAIDDPSLVAQAVFSALGLQDVSARWSLSALSDHLKDRRVLLVLDNCEHLLDSAAVLAGTLLRGCPELHILATSRRPLGMAGEVQLRVPPLAVPDSAGTLTPAQLASFDAIALFVERAGAVRPGFVVDGANAESVLRLCRRLDGMPLAVELAAVRLSGMTVDQLAAGVDRELAGAHALRGGEARQRTMEATLDWSFTLLSATEQHLWARLSVFAGGWTAEAAAAVCMDPGAPDDGLIESMAALVESSIIQLDDAQRPARYSMLEPVRDYGQKRLAELGEDVMVRTRHRDWVLVLVRRLMSFGEIEADGFKSIYRERHNVWSAMEFCRRQPGQHAAGVDIVAILTNYWLSRGPLGDARRYIDSLLPLTGSDRALRARCLTGCALFAAALDDADAAEVQGAEALSIASDLANPQLIGWAAGCLLFARFVEGRIDGVDELSRLMIETGKAIGAPAMVALAIHYTCSIWLAQDRVDEVIPLAEDGLAISRQAGDLFVRGVLLNSLAEARRRRGELAVAEALAREGVLCKRAFDDRRGIASLIETLAWIAADRRQDVRSGTLLGSAEALRQAMGVPLLAPFVARHAACVEAVRGRLGEAVFDKTLAGGRAMMVDEAVSYALGQTPAKAPPAEKPVQALSRRELEIAHLIAEGLTNKEIASRLFLSIRTVDTHVTNMLNKLGLNSRTQLARWVG